MTIIAVGTFEEKASCIRNINATIWFFIILNCQPHATYLNALFTLKQKYSTAYNMQKYLYSSL